MKAMYSGVLKTEFVDEGDLIHSLVIRIKENGNLILHKFMKRRIMNPQISLGCDWISENNE